MFTKMKIGAKWANRIWLYAQWKGHRQFIRSCHQLAAIQNVKLQTYLSRNADTQFGRSHDFASLKTYEDFIQAVPIQPWGEIQPWVDRIVEGEKSVLTEEAVIAFEETSGSTSASKLIPYTNHLKQEFETGIAPWMVGLYQSHPNTFDGPSYWSISPATKAPRKTTSGIPIGIEDDTEYFSPLTQYLLRNILATPGHIKNIRDPHHFYLQTLVHLLGQEKLSFISVWSPTFCLQLDRFLQEHRDEILQNFKRQDAISLSRKDKVKSILTSSFTWKDLWPSVSMLSCWTDAQSAMYIPVLQDRIGEEVPIQGKGLLSTEGIASIPVSPDHDPVLAIRSHFYEFRDIASGSVFLGHELQKGEVYELILTTGGGLYRYATGDLIQVNSFFHQAPCFRFLGRTSGSDLVGEKLSDYQVNEAILEVFGLYLDEIRFVFLYPQKEVSQSTYVLYLEAMNPEGFSFEPETLMPPFQEVLSQNPYFAQALQLGQLDNITCRTLSPGFFDRLRHWFQREKQIKDGDLKLPVLFKSGSLEELLV